MAIKIKIDVDKAELLAKFEKFKNEMWFGLFPAFMRIGLKLHNLEVSMAPVDTGRLAANIRTQPDRMSVTSRSNAIDPKNGYNYAWIQHWGGLAKGWPGLHYIRPRYYMIRPLYKVEPYAVDTIDDEIASIIARCGL